MAGPSPEDPSDRSPTPASRALIVGGGVAGIETALALRAFVPEEAGLEVEIVDPGLRFRVAATATGRAFGVGSDIDAPLATIVSRAGAVHRRARLAAVDAGRRLAMLAGGELLTYDALVVAVGARPEPFLSEALTFTGHADADHVRILVDGIVAAARRGVVTDLAVVVPPGCRWSLAAYELALMTRDRLVGASAGHAARITVVTAEPSPLAVFGAAATEGVRRALLRASIEIVAGAEVLDWRWGRLELEGREPVAADRVISLPVLRGPAIEGLPADEHGFLENLPDGRAHGTDGVWIVGDAGTFPVKQGGLACQQADSVAAQIARRMGVDVEVPSFHPVLRGWIWDGGDGRFVRGHLEEGHEESDGVLGPEPLWWPVAKVAGRFLTPFLEGLPGSAGLRDLPAGADEPW